MSHSSRSILVVDDEINILKSMRRLFKHAGYDVFTAESGEQGLAILDKEDIQVILSDFRMPHMDGGEFLAKVKVSHPYTVSLILSGYADFDSVLSVMNSGNAFKFLTKPWENKLLLSEVENAFKHYREKLQLASSLEQSHLFNNINQLNSILEGLLSQNTPFSIGYFELSNALDLKRQHILIQPLTQLLYDYLDSHWHNNFSIHMLSENTLVLLTVGSDEKIAFSRLVADIAQTNWQTLIENKVDVSVSFIASDALLESSQFILDTLKEATVLINESIGFAPLDQEYLLSKQRELIIKSDVIHALRKNQFYLVYQPKVTLASGLIESAEVLLRWEHKSLGWLSPGEFIDIAESDGQIIEISEWVIDNGLKELSRLIALSDQVQSLSINISASQLMNFNIVQTIAEGLKKYQIDPKKLEVEVTETSLMQNLNTTSVTLNELKKIGVKIAIDDFGVGYSSFAYLTKLPIDVLKLNRILLDDIASNYDTQVLIENLVKTCHNLNIKVVAEGIETKAALEKVSLTLCDYVQGFYYSEPVSINEIERLFIEQPFLLERD